ncbi:all-trans-retinol 13,14-reductase-like [Myxocyprinus asiaticus]|uniref:all-trans-retinol 13,14-reductase-like n=1 Tax=Myxocyprinus asiaticus TaxID=70543 RepID=UPI0022220997|nr:all-trans-retinol 13,14-reductase-like [Myxocyprinus asiaticus]
MEKRKRKKSWSQISGTDSDKEQSSTRIRKEDIRCARYGGNHEYGKCEQDVKPKCGNCGGELSACYEGCQYRKEAVQSVRASEGLTYAEALKKFQMSKPKSVSVIKGQEEVHIHAPTVISNAGIFNTYQQLLPKDVQAMPAIQKQLSMVQNGDNYWIFLENNFDDLVEGYMKGNREESAKNIPLFFVASPSAKDPTWQERKPGKSTITVVSFANYAWFEEWRDDKVKNRSADYKELKETFINSVVEAVTQIFPKIQDRIESVDAGTPITNQHYIGAPKGEICGADHGLPRFSMELNSTIRPQTPIKNLFLTGQDVFLCGFAGALAGALTCGSVLLNRNLPLDAIALAKKIKNVNNNKKKQ